MKDVIGLATGDPSLGIAQMSLSTAKFLDEGYDPKAYAKLDYDKREAAKLSCIVLDNPLDKLQLSIELLNPKTNLDYAAKYLDFLRDARGGYDDIATWLSDYNRGLTLDSPASEYGEAYWDILKALEAWGVSG